MNNFWGPLEPWTLGGPHELGGLGPWVPWGRPWVPKGPPWVPQGSPMGLTGAPWVLRGCPLGPQGPPKFLPGPRGFHPAIPMGPPWGPIMVFPPLLRKGPMRAPTWGPIIKVFFLESFFRGFAAEIFLPPYFRLGAHWALKRKFLESICCKIEKSITHHLISPSTSGP